MKSSLIEKIKKLLRLAKDGAATPAEAANALAKAIAIAAENDVDLSKIPDDSSTGAGMSHATEPSQAGVPHRLASRIVSRHFGVEAIFDSTGVKPVIHFVGLEENCHLAIYCYVYLVRSMRSAWRIRTNRRLRDRESFLRGYAGAIDRQMPAVFHRPGLVLSAKAYIEGVILAGKTGVTIKETKSKPKKLNAASAIEGGIAGSNAEIRNALRGSETLNLH